MITFKQFLNEEESVDLIDLLKRDCAPYLAAIKDEGIFRRGIRDLGEAKIAMLGQSEVLYSKKTVRKDRKPKDMRAPLHHMIDDWFDDQFNGIRPRSEGMFCFGESTRLRTLSQYGEVCFVFPIGDFKYIWSRKVDDLYNEVDHRPDIYNDEREFEEWMQSRDYQMTELHEAVQRNVEVMIVCDAYYAFSNVNEDKIREAAHEARQELRL